MNLKEVLYENWIAAFVKMLPKMTTEYVTFAKNYSRSNQSKTSQKELTDILMLTHALEKAFSLPCMRNSFGFDKALSLAELLHKYIEKYGYSESLNVPISLLGYYLTYHHNNDVADNRLNKISNTLRQIIKMTGKNTAEFQSAGVFEKTKAEMMGISHADFKTLAEGRFAIRNFDSTPVDEETIKEALEIASKSPSACNRQAYRAHIFEGKEKDDILKIQNGATSFIDSVNKVILINADLNRYYSREVHLGYVDASLFAMSLIYALTYKGIGTIPLTLGINSSQLSIIKKRHQIPPNEMPVLLIAIGNYADRFKVAMSHRNPVEHFTTYHK